MSRQANLRGGKYLYAVADVSDGSTYGNFGINGGSVYAVSNGLVAAIVSNVPNRKIRPERRHLSAHHEVLRRLMGKHTVLPMSFGIIADGPNAIKKILSRNQEVFLRQLRRLAGKVEMGLRINWDVPNIFEYFVNTHHELRAARDRFFGARREATQDDKIELGRMFDRILNEDREYHTEKVSNILIGHCYEIKRNECRNEREVMNLACLVDCDAQEKYEAAIFKAANLFDNNFSFDYNGPWAPYNFVEMDLEL